MRPDNLKTGHDPLLPLPLPGELVMQPLFPVALGQVQLRPDPLELAAQLQALLAQRGTACSNPDPGCAWTGDLNGVWQLQRHALFAGLIAELLGHAKAYLQQLGFDLNQVALHIRVDRPVSVGHLARRPENALRDGPPCRESGRNRPLPRSLSLIALCIHGALPVQARRESKATPPDDDRSGGASASLRASSSRSTSRSPAVPRPQAAPARRPPSGAQAR